jgi:choline dehydrogenase-like flavoprotein
VSVAEGVTLPVWRLVEIPRFEKLTRSTQADVCVVGAGISGLSAAYLLTRAGRSVVVVDAALLVRLTRMSKATVIRPRQGTAPFPRRTPHPEPSPSTGSQMTRSDRSGYRRFAQEGLPAGSYPRMRGGYVG